jgi:hypothetical protein
MVGGGFLIIGLIVAILYLEKNRGKDEDDENESGVNDNLGVDFIADVDDLDRDLGEDGTSEYEKTSIPELPPIGPPPSSE